MSHGFPHPPPAVTGFGGETGGDGGNRTPLSDRELFDAYRQQIQNMRPTTGIIPLSYGTWLNSGKPTAGEHRNAVETGVGLKEPKGQLSPRSVDVLRGLSPGEQAVVGAAGGVIPPPPPSLDRGAAETILAGREVEGLDLTDTGPPPTGEGVFGDIPPFPTDPPPEGFQWDYDPALNQWIPVRAPSVSPFQQQQLDVQQQQFQAQQASQTRQERARLSANPISWLQFADFTGEPPVVQPWMIPLGGQQGLQAGQPFPGLTRNPQSFEDLDTLGAFDSMRAAGVSEESIRLSLQAGQAHTPSGGFDFSTLPELTTPSTQFLSRAGPTAQLQWLGFKQARTGAIPEESLFRRRAGAPPGGSFSGLSRVR